VSSGNTICEVSRRRLYCVDWWGGSVVGHRRGSVSVYGRGRGMLHGRRGGVINIIGHISTVRDTGVRRGRAPPRAGREHAV
jgi:hypothetical protein